jgi:hypothetical protein
MNDDIDNGGLPESLDVDSENLQFKIKSGIIRHWAVVKGNAWPEFFENKNLKAVRDFASQFNPKPPTRDVQKNPITLSELRTLSLNINAALFWGGFPPHFCKQLENFSAYVSSTRVQLYPSDLRESPKFKPVTVLADDVSLAEEEKDKALRKFFKMAKCIAYLQGDPRAKTEYDALRAVYATAWKQYAGNLPSEADLPLSSLYSFLYRKTSGFFPFNLQDFADEGIHLKKDGRSIKKNRQIFLKAFQALLKNQAASYAKYIVGQAIYAKQATQRGEESPETKEELAIYIKSGWKKVVGYRPGFMDPEYGNYKIQMENLYVKEIEDFIENIDVDDNLNYADLVQLQQLFKAWRKSRSFIDRNIFKSHYFSEHMRALENYVNYAVARYDYEAEAQNDNQNVASEQDEIEDFSQEEVSEADRSKIDNIPLVKKDWKFDVPQFSAPVSNSGFSIRMIASSPTQADQAAAALCSIVEAIAIANTQALRLKDDDAVIAMLDNLIDAMQAILFKTVEYYNSEGEKIPFSVKNGQTLSKDKAFINYLIGDEISNELNLDLDFRLTHFSDFNRSLKRPQHTYDFKALVNMVSDAMDRLPQLGLKGRSRAVIGEVCAAVKEVLEGQRPPDALQGPGYPKR